jgi:hypothetical protein
LLPKEAIMAIEGLETRLLFAFTAAQPPIAPVVDDAGNSYVLGTDDLRMAVARYKPNGELDTAWANDGVHTMAKFTDEEVQDVPTAMTISKYGYLFVAGSSSGQWAVGRVNIDSAGSGQAWEGHYLTGTVNALSLDRSRDDRRLGVAGTSASGEVQVAVLYSFDTPGPGSEFHNGGTFDTSIGGGAGFVTAPASIYKLPASSAVSTSAAAIVKRDDLPSVRPGEGGNEWLVQGTVNYSPGNGSKRSRSFVVDFRPDGSSTARFDRGRGAASFDLFGGSAISSGGNSAGLTGRAPVRRDYASALLATQ